MSDHIQVPMTHLHEIATKFASMKTELDGTEQSATELHGVDANDGHLVATAVTDFLSECNPGKPSTRTSASSARFPARSPTW